MCADSPGIEKTNAQAKSLRDSVVDKGSLRRPVSLKDLANHLNLSPTALSLVLNGSPQANSIPQDTKDRIFAAARRFNYRPNFLARSLRSQRTYSIGVLVPELSAGYSALVLSGVEDFLIKAGYLYLVTSHRHNPKLIEDYPQLLFQRRVEGLIAVDTPCDHELPLPVVSVSGHKRLPGITNIVLNHSRAAELGLEHLVSLGHRRIAFFQGQSFSSDTEVRWNAFESVARRMGLVVNPKLVAQLKGATPSPELGYLAAMEILATREPFTALFAFNDISAIGAIRAFREAGLRVPEDVSVVGFDDTYDAAFHIPALTTIRQPLVRMGMLAAETVLASIAADTAEAGSEIEVEPDLVVRESTAAAPALRPSPAIRAGTD
ncbi:MAG TPA: LacI family transcriptional regulator [Solibacterales bacterium]|nr:LacI family transcriptional regulator [Bryobacterales bacterium]